MKRHLNLHYPHKVQCKARLVEWISRPLNALLLGVVKVLAIRRDVLERCKVVELSVFKKLLVVFRKQSLNLTF